MMYINNNPSKSWDILLFFVRLSETGYLQVKLQSGNIDYSSNVRLQVYTDPSCTYQLKILVSPVQMLGQVGGGLD